MSRVDKLKASLVTKALRVAITEDVVPARALRALYPMLYETLPLKEEEKEGYLYALGYQMGRKMEEEFEHIVWKMSKPPLTFKDFMYFFVKGATAVSADKIELEEVREDTAVVVNRTCAYCWGLEGKYSKPVCFYYSGAIAGATEAALGGTAVVEEVDCKAKGNEVCRFKVRYKP
ncbi:MAG: hypothetical protein DRN99_01380 [Thermoproteota archaeon]|nr:MAG: hypothetical protein DRN99_01380 [Candidatus Korarchaeota archaeon]